MITTSHAHSVTSPNSLRSNYSPLQTRETSSVRGYDLRCKRVSLWSSWLLLCILVLGASWTSAGEVSPLNKMLWSCYMICWPPDRDYQGFYDRPLERLHRDRSSPRLVDLKQAIDAGIDALSIDLFISDKNALPAFSTLVKLINDNHLPIQLSPMFDGLASPGVTIDRIAEKVIQWFQLFATEPCVVRSGGKPVLFTYGANQLEPAQWQALWQRLHAAGCDGYWIGELSQYLATGESPDFERARPWLDLFPAINSFNVHHVERAEDLIHRRQELSSSRPAWVAPVSMGYWRPEISVYASPQGTEVFRKNWKSVRDAGITWVQQSTWNDFSENHHLMPSENRGTVFTELNRFLALEWKGIAQEPDHPRFFLSQQQEVLTGEDSHWELVALLPARSVPVTVDFQLSDVDGHSVHSFPQTCFDKPGLQVVTHLFPVLTVPEGRLLFGDATFLGQSRTPIAQIHSPFTVITADGYRPERNRTWLYTSAQAAKPAPFSCELTLLSPGQPEIELQVQSASELADVELLRNGKSLSSLHFDTPELSLDSPFRWKGKLPVNRRGMLDWGYYTARATTVDGRTVQSRPVFVDSSSEAALILGSWNFDADSDTEVLDSSPWMHDGRLGGRQQQSTWMPTHVEAPWGGKCLQFDGVDDRILLEGAIVPPDSYTVECWIKPAAPAAEHDSNQILFATAGGAVVLGIDDQGRLQVTRRSDERWHRVRDPLPLSLDEWQHVACTYDGTVLRLYRDGVSAGEIPAPGTGRCGQVAIGYNPVTTQGFYVGCLDEVNLSARALKPHELSLRHLNIDETSGNSSKHSDRSSEGTSKKL